MSRPSEQTGNAAVRPLTIKQSMRDHESTSVDGSGEAMGPEVVGYQFFQCRLANRPKITLPKDASLPLVTNDGNAVSPAVEAFKSLRTQLMKLRTNRGVRSVAIASPAMSDGKTLTTFNLACTCAQLEETPVLLIDSDLRTRGLTNLIGKMPAVGLADVLAGTASYEDAIVRTDIPNLYIMGAGTVGDVPAAELFSTDRWQQLVNWASDLFKMVLVDSLPVGGVTDVDLIAEGCDGILVVVRALKTSQRALTEAFGHLDSKKVLGVVWNSARRSVNAYYGYGSR
jgi:capsular exopolysaccharide synthesis family protein